jgi:hypothetical protein
MASFKNEIQVRSGSWAKSRLWAYSYALGCFLDMFNALTSGTAKSVWIPNLMLGLLALAVMAFPSRQVLVQLLGAAFAINTIWHYPHIFNSNLILALIGFAIAVDALIARVKGKLKNSVWTEKTFAAARLTFVLCYATAALSKWNSSFFTPDNSCGVWLPIIGIKSIFPWVQVSPEQLWFMPFFVAISESLVVILLAVPALRRLGVAWAILFHLGVSFAPGVPGVSFTAIILAGVLLYLPEDTSQRIVSLSEKYLYSTSVRRWFWRSLMLAFGVLILVGSHKGLFGLSGFDVKYVGAQTLVLSLGLVTLFAIYKTRKIAMPTRAYGIASWHFALAVAAVMIAAEPYVGLGNTPALTMFSNLRTEDHKSNHFFIPRFDVGNLEDDMVRLYNNGAPSTLLSKYAFSKYALGTPVGETIDYYADGIRQTRKVTEAWRKKVDAGWLAYKLWDVAPIQSRCSWKAEN